MRNWDLTPEEIYLLVIDQDIREQIDRAVAKFQQEYGGIPHQ